MHACIDRLRCASISECEIIIIISFWVEIDFHVVGLKMISARNHMCMYGAVHIQFIAQYLPDDNLMIL